MPAIRAFSLLDVCSCSLIVGLTTAIATPLLGAGKAEMNPSGALAKAVFLYTEDNNDHFPLGATRRANGTWRSLVAHPAPPNVVASAQWNAPQTAASVGSFWANSIRGYVRKPSDYKEPLQRPQAIDGDVLAPGVTPLEVGLTFNGLLHAYGESAVVKPALVPVVWAGMGNIALKGRAAANPVLNCPGLGECRFNPTGKPQLDWPAGDQPAGMIIAPYTQFADASVWAKRTSDNAGGGTIAFADGSAKFMKWGTAIAPKTTKNAVSDMYASIQLKDGAFESFFYHGTNTPDCSDIKDSSTTAGKNYPCFFRPDRIK